MNDYTPEQIKVIQTAARHVQVLAYAGTGKTKTLCARVDYLLAQGVLPAQILVLSFSNDAVDVLKARLPGGVIARTFHAFGQAQVHQHHRALGMKRRPPLLTPTDRRELIQAAAADCRFARNQLRREADIDLRQEDEMDRLANFFMRIQGDGRVAQALAADPNSDYADYADVLPHLKTIHRRFRARKDAAGMIDYADMLRHACAALDEGTADLPYRYLFIDESQDMNQGQVGLLHSLSKQVPYVMTFGDPYQSIFGFAGSRHLLLSSLLDKVTTLALTRSFRLTQRTADLACAILAGKTTGAAAIRGRESGQAPLLVRCGTSAEQSRLVVDAVQTLVERSGRPDEIAVLARTKAQLRDVEFALLAHGFETRPLYVDRKPHSMMVLLDLLELVQRCAQRQEAGTPFDREQLERRLLATAGMTALSNTEVVAECRRDLLRIPRCPTLEGRYIGARKLYEKLLRAAGQLEPAVRVELGRWEPLCHRFASVDELRAYVVRVGKQPAIATSTIHGAKGREWDRVLLIGVTDGSLPFYREIARDVLAEERRLFYVAATRARDRLYLFQAPFHHAPSRQTFNAPSRFMTKRVARLLQVRGTKDARGLVNSAG